jgi:hypothetical protein
LEVDFVGSTSRLTIDVYIDRPGPQLRPRRANAYK